jgi:RHS repeat-associated protein
MTDPLGNSITYAYDAANEVTSSTDRNGRTINLGYDQASRLTGETWVGGSYTATYTYDKDSELTKAQDPFSSYTFGYDSLGNLATVSNAGTPGMPTVTLNYGYDQFFDRTSLSDSLGGSITYGYDNDLRMTSLGLSVGSTLEAQVTLGYDAASRLTGTTATSNGSTTTITQSLVYDNADRLTNQTYTAKTGTQTVTLANYTYGYDKASQLTSYQDANSNMTYGYDPSGQLTAATGTLAGLSWTASYAFDLNGNRTSSTINSSTTTYTNGTGNELKSDGTYSYAYDNEGNLTAQTQIATGTVTYYSYDYHNQLVEAKVQSSTGLVLNDEKFTYDVFGNRIGISLNGSQQLWTMYDGSNPYIDFNGSGQVTERYLTDPRGINDLYARVSPSGTVNWYVTDNLGSVRQIVNSSGTMVNQVAYDPYGNIVSQMFPGNGDRFKFAGGEYDNVVGTDHFGARYYSPVDGQWQSQDPLGFGAGDANLYRYVGNSPTNGADPTGLMLIPFPIERPPLPIVSLRLVGPRGDWRPGLRTGEASSYEAGYRTGWELGQKGVSREAAGGASFASESGSPYFSAGFWDGYDGNPNESEYLDRAILNPPEVTVEVECNVSLLIVPPFCGNGLAGELQAFRQTLPAEGAAAVARTDLPGLAPAARGALFENPSQVVAGRVAELRGQIQTAQQGRITMGVAVVEDASGARSVLVSTSEPRGYLRPGVTLNPGETMVAGTGHAEADIINYARANNLRVIDIGATRPVCVPCQDAINPTGANISTPLRPRPAN